MMRKLFIGILVLITIVAPLPVYAANHVPPSHIYCMGDSTTAFFIPYYLSILTGIRHVVYDDGVGGNTSGMMLARFTDNVTSNSAQGDYVVIWGGVNDAGTDVDNTVTKANLQAMYDTANAAGLKVVALTLSPFKNSVLWTVARGAQADAVSTWIRAKPSHVDYVIDAHALLQDPADHDALLPAYDDGSHLHLSAAGQQLIANAIYNTIFPTITSPLPSSGYSTYIKLTTLHVGSLMKK
jgi:lysophospholipase L1-like esterase